MIGIHEAEFEYICEPDNTIDLIEYNRVLVNQLKGRKVDSSYNKTFEAAARARVSPYLDPRDIYDGFKEGDIVVCNYRDRWSIGVVYDSVEFWRITRVEHGIDFDRYRYPVYKITLKGSGLVPVKTGEKLSFDCKPVTVGFLVFKFFRSGNHYATCQDYIKFTDLDKIDDFFTGLYNTFRFDVETVESRPQKLFPEDYISW